MFRRLILFVGPGNGSPMATNVILVVLVVVGLVLSCCKIFKVLKLFHFTADRN